MKRYELKDKEKQRMLEKLLPDFDQKLRWAYSEGSNREMGGIDDLVTIRIHFHLDDVELVEAYDPDKWNNYPEVTPPEGVPLQVEASWMCGAVLHGCLVFEDGEWFFPNGESFISSASVTRFRAQNDEEKKNE